MRNFMLGLLCGVVLLGGVGAVSATRPASQPSIEDRLALLEREHAETRRRQDVLLKALNDAGYVTIRFDGVRSDGKKDSKLFGQ